MLDIPPRGLPARAIDALLERDPLKEGFGPFVCAAITAVLWVRLGLQRLVTSSMTVLPL